MVVWMDMITWYVISQHEYSILMLSMQMVTLRASTNNHASTVLDLFLDAATKHGYPSCVCGDCSGENIELAVWMIMHCGPSHGSFLWGS